MSGYRNHESITGGAICGSAFAARKVSELDEYDKALEKREEDKALVDSGKMTKEEFIANALIEPGCPPCSSSFVVNDEMRNDEGLFYKVAAWPACELQS
jgi:hypothetical protein